jgi:hypothetical protein
METAELTALVKKLWRGDVPLVWTFWVLGIVGGLVVGVLKLIADASPAVIFVALLVPSLAIQVLWWVAVLRSADKYAIQHRGGARAHWGLAAQLMAVASAVRFVVTLFWG